LLTYVKILSKKKNKSSPRREKAKKKIKLFGFSNLLLYNYKGVVMIKKILVILILLSFPLFCCAGKLRDKDIKVRDAKPSESFTILEFNPGVNIINDSKGLSSNFLTTKFYYSLRDIKYNFGIEVPLLRQEANHQGLNGLGDILLATNYSGNITNNFLYGLQLELGTPTATKPELGYGRFEIRPAAFLEYSFLGGFFIAGGLKYYHTFWGNSARDTINKLRIRTNFGYISPNNLWLIIDPQYYIDFENQQREELYLEIEGGFMFHENVAFYLKPGFHAAGGWHTQDWSVQLGIKFFDLI